MDGWAVIVGNFDDFCKGWYIGKMEERELVLVGGGGFFGRWVYILM